MTATATITRDRNDQRRRRRHGAASEQRPRRASSEIPEQQVVSVYGDDTTPNVRMFPSPAAASCSNPEVWTPSRLRRDDTALAALLGQTPAVDLAC